MDDEQIRTLWLHEERFPTIDLSISITSPLSSDKDRRYVVGGRGRKLGTGEDFIVSERLDSLCAFGDHRPSPFGRDSVQMDLIAKVGAIISRLCWDCLADNLEDKSQRIRQIAHE